MCYIALDWDAEDSLPSVIVNVMETVNPSEELFAESTLNWQSSGNRQVIVSALNLNRIVRLEFIQKHTWQLQDCMLQLNKQFSSDARKTFRESTFLISWHLHLSSCWKCWKPYHDSFQLLQLLTYPYHCRFTALNSLRFAVHSVV